jgi:hypothetical protein
MNLLATFAAGVFSFCTPDFCAMGPPLRIWPAPIARPGPYFPPPRLDPKLARPFPPPPRPAPPPVQQPPTSDMDADRERVIEAGEAHCRRWPQDKICHALPEGGQR